MRDYVVHLIGQGRPSFIEAPREHRARTAWAHPAEGIPIAEGGGAARPSVPIAPLMTRAPRAVVRARVRRAPTRRHERATPGLGAEDHHRSPGHPTAPAPRAIPAHI